MLKTSDFPTRYKLPTASSMRQMQGFAKYFIKGDPTPSDDSVIRLGKSMMEGDTLADAWLDDTSVSRTDARDLLNKALDEGIESIENAPQSLVNLFAQLDVVPMWVDPYLLNLGAESFQRTGPIGDIVLSQVSLMAGYQSAPAIKPLTFTGDLTQRASGRLGETTQFVKDVTTPGAMTRYGVGFKAAVRVRVMHAMVRKMISSSDKWQPEDWGLAINIGDTLGTNQMFSYTFMMACRAMGIQYNATERHSLIHLWRYIGYLMGIPEDLLPATESEASRLLYLMKVTMSGPDEDSVALAQALYEVPMVRAKTPAQKKKAKFEMAYKTGLCRALIGKKAADDLQLPDTFFKYTLFVSTPIVFLLETVRRLVPGGTKFAIKFGGRWYGNYSDGLTTGEKNQYVPVKKLAAEE